MNYLPFALREITTPTYTTVGTTTMAASHISSFSLGNLGKAYLQDLSLRFVLAADDIFIRLGWLGQGYIMERAIPFSSLLTQGRPRASVWPFIKPYRLLPGQHLRVELTPRGSVATMQHTVAFHGIRELDNVPVVLHESTAAIAATTQAALIGDGYKCPADSPVLLYSVSFDDVVSDLAAVSDVIQIYGSDGRKWFKWANYDTAALFTATFEEDHYIDPIVDLIELGETNGWIMNPDQTLLVEILSNFAFRVALTLRGSVEVE